jgi:hypothetical protein
LFQVTVYHLLKLFQSETDIALGKKSLVAELYDELVSYRLCKEFDSKTSYYDRLVMW